MQDAFFGGPSPLPKAPTPGTELLRHRVMDSGHQEVSPLKAATSMLQSSDHFPAGQMWYPSTSTLSPPLPSTTTQQKTYKNRTTPGKPAAQSSSALSTPPALPPGLKLKEQHQKHGSYGDGSHAAAAAPVPAATTSGPISSVTVSSAAPIIIDSSEDENNDDDVQIVEARLRPDPAPSAAAATSVSRPGKSIPSSIFGSTTVTVDVLLDSVSPKVKTTTTTGTDRARPITSTTKAHGPKQLSVLIDMVDEDDIATSAIVGHTPPQRASNVKNAGGMGNDSDDEDEPRAAGSGTRRTLARRDMSAAESEKMLVVKAQAKKRKNQSAVPAAHHGDSDALSDLPDELVISKGNAQFTASATAATPTPPRARRTKEKDVVVVLDSDSG
ncbi:hypothetical protein BC828DRAFT_383001 [Blastocladiella britannica]|nr:hypothetical protein BC828DRAFT_383001 [Blastocladiella britannica]